ncbi:hypothetical protein [Thalassobacillus devorans]|uniref:hypothetical protein n=1 Tax=Thalassobacillus devorans TaxID=279813 RepID=UPI00141BD18A|nr:hypothetical protein [Thalassobacillus devorans]
MNYKLEKLVMVLPVMLILLQRISIPLYSFQLPMIIPVIYAFVILFFLIDKIKINIYRLLLFIALVFILSLTTVLNGNYVITSYLYLIVIYLPFVFVIQNPKLFNQLISYFQNIMFFVALVGIFQFVLQFYFEFFDPMTKLPAEFHTQGYVSTGEVAYGSGIFRANGVFFLEASFFSQFLAIAIVIEIYYFKRIKRIFIKTIALICTFSGTGLLILLLFSIPFIKELKFNHITKVLIFVVPFFIYFIGTSYGDSLIARIGELTGGSKTNSGYIRFFGPLVLLEEQINKDALIFLKGMGAGLSDDLWHFANNPALVKLLLEYGFFSTLIFSMFFFFVLWQSQGKWVVKSSLLVMYMFLSGALLQPQTVYLNLLFASLFIKKG